MNRTRLIFVGVIAVAIVIVAIGLISRATGATTNPIAPAASTDPIELRIVTALPIEQWVTEAATAYNGENHQLDGRRVKVTIIPMDGLTALNRFDSAAFDVTPTVWIPDSRYLVELANAAYKDRLGRDVFLTDGEYRAKPIALSLFAWGLYGTRATALEAKFGTIDWKSIHDAAIAAGGWPELGGDAAWGFFKLVVPNPRKNVGGLAAMVAAAGEYYDKPNISVEDVTRPEFQKWLKELMGSVTAISGASAYTAEDFALLGYSVGDGGQMLESDLLANMAGIATRWQDPLAVRYPKYVTWFDFPFSVWIGPETTAADKNAALDFQKYLLSKPVQEKAVVYGLRPVNAEVSVDRPDSPFTRWKDAGITPVVQRTSAMRSPDRDVLQSLLRWFDLNIAQR
ncbi:MAG: substrate-binding domain-containing protein [Chloroflexi bacterium]|nr:substrate-binding domain-containing protein [Chloroflexota bacterium]